MDNRKPGLSRSGGLGGVLRDRASWVVGGLLVLACSVCALPLLAGLAALGLGAAIGWVAAVPPLALAVACLAPVAFLALRGIARRRRGAIVAGRGDRAGATASRPSTGVSEP